MPRVYPKDDGLWLKEGEYGQSVTGGWFARPPGCSMGDLSGHEVVEHEDGTITVTPSILIQDDDGKGGLKELWHGYLTRGEFKSV